MRVLVFDHSSNPSIDSAIYKLSAARAEEMITSGQAHRIDARRIQKYCPIDDLEDKWGTWITRQISLIPGGVLRVATRQLAT